MLHDVWLRFQIWYWSWRARRLAVRVVPVMAVTVHVFQEELLELQDKHLDLWFGNPVEGGSACRCGGRLVAMDRKGDCLAVYHLGSVGAGSG